MGRISSFCPLFSFDAPGFLVNPQHAKILCSYPSDGGTAEKKCLGIGKDRGTCLPGCLPPSLFDDHGHPNAINWCGEEDPSQHQFGMCPHRPEKIGDMVEQAISLRNPGNGVYNEVIVEADSFVKNLPWSIGAFFFPVGGIDTKPEAERRAREVCLDDLDAVHFVCTTTDLILNECPPSARMHAVSTFATTFTMHAVHP